MPVSGNVRLLYGVAIRDAIKEGNLEQMQAFASVSSSLLANAGDLEDAEKREWELAHQELLSAIGEKAAIKLRSDDIVGIRDSIIVIDNTELAKALKPLITSEIEPSITVTVRW